MQPQGTAPVNADYFDKLTTQINSIDLCADLQALVNGVMASLQAEISAIEEEIAAILPLLTIPTDLGSVITWITNFIAPMQAAYTKFVAQLAAMLAKITALTDAIASAASRITSCSITIPPITL